MIGGLGKVEGSEGITEGRKDGRGRFRGEASACREEEGRAASGNRDGGKHGVRLIHIRDSNSSGKKAVTLEGLEGFEDLKK